MPCRNSHLLAATLATGGSTEKRNANVDPRTGPWAQLRLVYWHHKKASVIHEKGMKVFKKPAHDQSESSE
jgi:hypothetical protein